MAWPSANVSLANVDSSSDRISSAREDIYDAFTKLNAIIGEGPAIEAVAVSGQDTVVYSGANGTLTLVAGDNVTLTTNNTAKSVTITSAGGALVDDPDPTLSASLNVNGNYITSVGYSYVGVNDTLIALSSVAAMAGDTSFTGNAVSMSMSTTTSASIGTNNYSSGNPNGVSLNITGDGVYIWSYNGDIDLAGTPKFHGTGTPSNTSTPSGWIAVKINGVTGTKYIPYYT